MKEIWSSILKELGGRLPEGKFKVFLEPLKGDVVRLPQADRSGGQGLLIEPAPAFEWEVRLTAMNDFMAGQVRDQFSQAIAEVASSLLGGRAKVVVRASSSRKKAELPRPATLEQVAASIPSTAPAVLMADKQLDLPIPLPRVRAFNPAVMKGWKHSFEDFVVGPCNQIAYAAASNILAASAPVDMVFLCAGAGLGKTHLTQAVGRALSLEADKRQVRMEYLTAEEFTSQFVQAMKYKTIDQFKERFRDLDMLLLEDVHFLRGKDRTQEELLSTIKNLQDHGGRVVLTSSFAPRDLAGVDSQLVSRFCSGFVASMERPAAYSVTIAVETWWSGGSGTATFTAYTRDGVTRVDAPQLDGSVRRVSVAPLRVCCRVRRNRSVGMDCQARLFVSSLQEALEGVLVAVAYGDVGFSEDYAPVVYDAYLALLDDERAVHAYEAVCGKLFLH